jgi:hypothetical protein
LRLPHVFPGAAVEDGATGIENHEAHKDHDCQDGDFFKPEMEAAEEGVRIPRHSATRSTNIRPVIPPTSGHPFHEHPAT